MEREKGFEPGVTPTFSSLHAGGDLPGEGSTRPPEAPLQGSSEPDTVTLPAPTVDLFVTAGAVCAERAARGEGSRVHIEDILRRAASQAAALQVVPG